MRLDLDVAALVAELARAQDVKCAFCDEIQGLIVEHDHYPELGSDEKPTVYNIRGLACSGCNWHLGMYEADERGDCGSTSASGADAIRGRAIAARSKSGVG